jgi:hypothetical protein
VIGPDSGSHPSFEPDTNELHVSARTREQSYEVSFTLPGETKPDPARACDELFAHSEISTFSFELERRGDFRIGPQHSSGELALVRS